MMLAFTLLCLCVGAFVLALTMADPNKLARLAPAGVVIAVGLALVIAGVAGLAASVVGGQG